MTDSPAAKITSPFVAATYFLLLWMNSTPFALRGLELGSKRIRETIEFVNTRRFFLSAFAS